MPWRHEVREVEDLEVNLDGPVMLGDREGVFVHSFKCRVCRLEFQLFSWRRERHMVETTFCPECGTRGRKLHWRLPVNESPAFGSGTEIYRLNPYPHSGGFVDDSDLTGDWGPTPDEG